MLFKIAGKPKPPTPAPETSPLPPQLAQLMGGGAPPGVDPEPDPQDPNEGMEPQEGEDSPGSVDPSIAGYMGPEYGPCVCQNCVHFLEPNACHIVAGNIDPQGFCRIFTPESPQEDAIEPMLDESQPPVDESIPQGAPNV